MLTTPDILAMWVPGTWELLIILAIGLLLFGRRLPEVGRSLGKSIVEFKKGIKGIEDEIDSASTAPEQLDSQKKQQSLASDERTVPQTDAPPASTTDPAGGPDTASHNPA